VPNKLGRAIGLLTDVHFKNEWNR